MQTIYANVFAMRTTASELVIEFGVFFPASDEELQAGPSGAERNLRVIMSRTALAPLTEALNEVARQIASNEVR